MSLMCKLIATTEWFPRSRFSLRQWFNVPRQGSVYQVVVDLCALSVVEYVPASSTTITPGALASTCGYLAAPEVVQAIILLLRMICSVTCPFALRALLKRSSWCLAVFKKADSLLLLISAHQLVDSSFLCCGEIFQTSYFLFSGKTPGSSPSIQRLSK